MKRLRHIQLLLPAGLSLVFLSLLPSEGIQGKIEFKIKSEDLTKLSPAMRDELASLQYILNAHQVRQFLLLESDSLRARWLEIYWKSQDPTPVTPYNEKLIEHAVRARLARQFFKLEKWPGWDKRGEVFIRYGPPDYRGKIWGEVTPHKMRPPGELWFYRRHNMLVSFQNYGLHGEYIYSLNPFGSAQDASPELIEFLLYDTDQSLTSKIPQNLLDFRTTPRRDDDNEIAFKTRNPEADPATTAIYFQNRIRTRDLPESIDDIMNKDLTNAIPKDVAMVFQMDEVEEVANNFEKVLEDNPSSYPFNFTNKPLPYFFSIDQFKGGMGTNRVDVNIQVPVESSDEDSTIEDQRFKATAVVWDEQYNELSRDACELVLKTEKGAGDWTKLIPTQLVFTVKVGYYRIGITVESELTGASTSYKTTLSSEKFDKKLAISDILFASKITRHSEASMWSRGPLYVVPHPIRVYKQSFPMPVYFEAYNLTLDEREMTSYTVEYKVIPHKKKKTHFWDNYSKPTPVVSSSFHASGYNRDDSHYFSLGTDNMWEGSYDLLITVRDDINHTTAHRKSTFSIVE